MSKRPQASSRCRAFLLLLAGACAAWLQGCATQQKAQHKVYVCNLATVAVSEVRIHYSGALWAVPTLPAQAKDTNDRCQGGYAITTTLPPPESVKLEWVQEGRRHEMSILIRSRLNGTYPTIGIQLVFQKGILEVFEHVSPASNHIVRLRIFPPGAPKPAPEPRKPIQVTGISTDELSTALTSPAQQQVL